MKKWTISKRVTVGFTAVILTALALGLIAFLQIRQIQAASVVITDRNIPGIEIIARAGKLSTANRLLIYKHISSVDKDDMRNLEKQITEQRAQVSDLLDKLAPTLTSAEGRRLFSELLAARQRYREKSDEILALSQANVDVRKTYDRARAELDPIGTKYSEMLDDIIRFEMDDAARGATAINDTVRGSTWSILIGIVVAALIGIAVGYGIVSSTGRVLRAVSTSIDDAAAQVASAASQVSESSQTLASGSSQQAASLEETSASLEEMSAMTKRNADSAARAKEVSNRMRAAAETGAADVEEMNRAMAAIKGSSDEISKIVKTIDEIAFQTNILALNAAVEAARAGEAGMGFAVVADEVRNLAQRSAQSAKETAAKIEDSVSRSEQGVRVSQKVSQSLTDIVASAREADSLVAEIAQASREQQQGIGQLNTAVAQMDKVTQTNASTAEETASAAEELNAQAAMQKDSVRELIELVGGAGGRSSGGRHSAGLSHGGAKRSMLGASLGRTKPAMPRNFTSQEPLSLNGNSIVANGRNGSQIETERLAFKDM